jgi:hypothetical protein
MTRVRPITAKRQPASKRQQGHGLETDITPALIEFALARVCQGESESLADAVTAAPGGGPALVASFRHAAERGPNIRGRHAKACRVRVAAWRDRLLSIAPRLERGEGDTAARKGAASPLRLLIGSETAAPPDPDEGRDGPSVGARNGPEDGRGLAHTARRFARARGLDPDAPGPGRPP